MKKFSIGSLKVTGKMSESDAGKVGKLLSAAALLAAFGYSVSSIIEASSKFF